MSDLSYLQKANAAMQGVSDDIRELLADLDQADAARRDRVFGEARACAARTGKSAYLTPTALGWSFSPDAPSKYHEGTVIEVPPTGACVTHHFDGDRSN